MEIDTQTHHPNPQPDPHHRKIELQSPLDLTYLQENLAKSALAKLDLHFPPIPTASKPATVISLDGSSQPVKPTTNPEEPQTNNTTTTEIEIEPDPLRMKVQSLLSTFLQQTWSNAQLNLSVNNLDASTHPIPSSAILKPLPPPSSPSPTKPQQADSKPPQPVEIEGQTFQYAPYSPHLQTKLSTLYNELEKLTSEVSQLRRVAPRQGAQRYISSLTSALESEDTSHEVALQNLLTHEQENAPDVGDMRMREGWNEDTKEIYQLGIEELDSLAGMGNNNTTATAQDQSKPNNGNPSVNGNGKGKRKREGQPSLTETMGKVQRARTVALEME